MKIVAGIDELERSKGLLHLLEALKFTSCELTLLNVIERLGESSIPNVQQDLIARFLKMQEAEASALLKTVRESLGPDAPYKVTSELLSGFSANKVIQHASDTKADILALGSSGKGLLQKALVGSVGKKALITAPCSVLISRNAAPLQRPLHVVLATDHSDYAKRWLDKFIAWKPQGLGKLTVVTVQGRGSFVGMGANVAQIESEFSSWMQNELKRRNEECAQRLSSLAQKVSSRVEAGERVDDTLDRVMLEEKADLLVLGAQGHGFLERALIGSVSLEMALGRQHSVLVVRS